MRNEIEFRVEWADTDPAGITFYPNFFKWYDNGTWHLLFRAGLTWDVLRNELGLAGCPIVDARSKFVSPARFWDVVQLSSAVTAWHRKAFEVTHHVRVDGRLCAEAVEVRVCARYAPERGQQLEAVAVPAEFRQRLEALL